MKSSLIEPLINEAARLADRIRVAQKPRKRGGLNEGKIKALEHLRVAGPMTVPRLASSRGVSRQSIQVLTNDLIKEGIIETLANPAHKSSRLLRITEKGLTLLEGSKSRAAEALSALGAGVSEREIRFAAEILRAVREALPG